MHDWITDEIMDEFISDYSQYEMKVKEILGSSLKIYIISYNHRLINHETFFEMIVNDERVRIAQFNYLEVYSYPYTRAYPNPARNYVEFYVFTTNDIAIMEIKIFNTKGQLVKTINDGFRWDLKDENNQTVPSGVYFFYTRPQFLPGRFIIIK